MASGSTARWRTCSCQASAEHFQQCAEFSPLRNRALGLLAVTVLPVPLARRGAATRMPIPANSEDFEAQQRFVTPIPFDVVTPHMLRHGCGFKLANDGVDTRALQHFLGHRNIMHTVRYTELRSDRFGGFWKD